MQTIKLRLIRPFGEVFFYDIELFKVILKTFTNGRKSIVTDIAVQITCGIINGKDVKKYAFVARAL